MKVKVILKRANWRGEREFEFGEAAVLDDREAGRAVLSCGSLSGGRIGDGNFHYEDTMHVVYAWCDIERIEVTP